MSQAILIGDVWERRDGKRVVVRRITERHVRFTEPPSRASREELKSLLMLSHKLIERNEHCVAALND